MRLIELDGRRAGPVDHGECKDLLTVGHNFHVSIVVNDYNVRLV
jgi:hypothetical protein